MLAGFNFVQPDTVVPTWRDGLKPSLGLGASLCKRLQAGERQPLPAAWPAAPVPISIRHGRGGTTTVYVGDYYERTGSVWTTYYRANGQIVGYRRSTGCCFWVSGGASASFVYDGDGHRVKATTGGTTTVYVGGYYEKTGSNETRNAE